MTTRVFILAGLSGFLLMAAACAKAGPQDGAMDRKMIALEALSRLKGADLETVPSLKAAAFKVLEWTRGTPDFVTIVQDFHIPGQNAGLLKVAENNPADGSGVAALQIIFASGDTSAIKDALNGTNLVAATKTSEALGNTHDKQIVPLLLPLLTDMHRDVSVRKQSVRSLAETPEGAAALLQLARVDKLPGDVRFTASMELNAVRWPELKAQAAQLLPLPQSHNTAPLPPVQELLKMPGDTRRGAQVFARQEVGCINCHRINEKGVDLGPALSEIGNKLGKDALYEAILDPSAGIAFGYEAWQIDLRSGDETYGIIVSETADEIVLKDAKAIATRIRKSDITKRRQSKTSLMPAGLQQTMSTQDLVDLVEYLSSLKKVQ